MRILVTGGAGFIGSKIVQAYIEAGHEVGLIDNDFNATPNENATAWCGDICTEGLVDFFASKFKPDVVSHHAAKISVTDSMTVPGRDAQTNIVGSLNVLQAAIECGAKRFIFASSAAVYGESHWPISEQYPTHPTSPYGVAKLAVENYLRIFSDQITPVILRYANVYEMSERGAGVYSQFYRALQNGEPCTIRGDGCATRDYVHVEDVAAANVAALTRGDGETLNISTKTETTTLQVFNQVRKHFGKYDLQPVFAESGAGEVSRSVSSNTKAREVLKWSPVHTLSV
jgi:UDP-glucose 4-epimerase